MKQNNVGAVSILSGDQSDDKLKFYQEKMHLITESNGIYSLVHGLVQNYLSNVNKENNEGASELEDLNGAREEYGKKNKSTVPLCFCEKPETRVIYSDEYNIVFFYDEPDDKMTNLAKDGDIREKVRHFVYHLINLFKGKNFARFIISDKDSFNVIKKILLSDFVIKREGFEEFFLNFDELVIDLISILGVNNKNINVGEVKNLILDYLKKVDNISPRLASKLLDQEFWLLFKGNDKVPDKFIIPIFDKLYLKPFFSLTSFHLYYDHESIRFADVNGICKKILNEEENVMPMGIKNAVRPILIRKLTEVFRDKNICLSDFFNKRHCSTASFLLDYCEKNDDNEKKNLLTSLKQWAQDSLKEKSSIDIGREVLDNEICVKLFSLDEELKNIFNQITASVQESEKQKNDIKENRSVIKNDPMYNHEKTDLSINIKDLILVLFIYLVCISLIIIGLITIPVFWPKLFLLIPFSIMCVLFCMFIEICKKIENSRRSIAIQDIKNSKTKSEARNKIPFDMFWRKEVKDCFNQLPESENSPNEIHT